MSKIVDARGLACPQPVVLTRNALQESDAVTTIVDNETARQNVTRMAEKAGATVKVEKRDDVSCGNGSEKPFPLIHLATYSLAPCFLRYSAISLCFFP